MLSPVSWERSDLMARKPFVMAEEFARLKESQKQQLGSALAERLGPPPGGHRVSDAELAEKWSLPDPAVTPELVAEMQASGATPDDITRAIYPEREKTYTVAVVGAEAQRKEAERISRLAQQQQPPPDFLSQSLGPIPAPPAQRLPTDQPSASQPALSVPAEPAPTPAMPTPQHVAGPSPAVPQRQSKIEGYY
jgi:hypothetical protein